MGKGQKCHKKKYHIFLQHQNISWGKEDTLSTVSVPLQHG